MHFSSKDLASLDKIKRLNLINSITGIKPANLIGTKSAAGHSNLAIFSSVIHLGSKPALIGFMLRPKSEVPRHTYQNLKETKQYTINQIQIDHITQAHYTSCKFEAGQSEFEQCGFTEEYLSDFTAPFVKESTLKMGLLFQEEIPIKSNGTTLIIGEIQHLVVDQKVLSAEGYLNLELSQSVGISGLNTYYRLKQEKSLPYARANDLPDFNKLD